MKSQSPMPARPRGRPRGAGDLQQVRLLDAAEQLLPGSPDDFSLRRVALLAEVTPPLAHYYFGNREGLLRALISDRAGPRIDELLLAARDGTRPVPMLTQVMQQLTVLCATDLFVRSCLLQPAGEPLRARVRVALTQLLRAAQAAGQLRTDISASCLADTLLGLCVFPFLDASGGDDMAARAAALTLQHVALLKDGIRGRAPHS